MFATCLKSATKGRVGYRERKTTWNSFEVAAVSNMQRKTYYTDTIILSGCTLNNVTKFDNLQYRNKIADCNNER